MEVLLSMYRVYHVHNSARRVGGVVVIWVYRVSLLGVYVYLDPFEVLYWLDNYLPTYLVGSSWCNGRV